MSSSILDVMKFNLLEARKARDTRTTNALVTLVSEIENMYRGTKDHTREPDNADAITKIKRFVKSLDGNLELDLTDAQRADALWEKELLEQYLPKQMTEADLEEFTDKMIEGLRIGKDPKKMGLIMKELRILHDGQYDGKLASEVVKRKLSPIAS